MIRYYRAAEVPEKERKRGIGRRRFLLQSGKGLAWLGLGATAADLAIASAAKASTDADFFGGIPMPDVPPDPYGP